jgi:hypothetical protein
MASFPPSSSESDSESESDPDFCCSISCIFSNFTVTSPPGATAGETNGYK